MPRSFMDVFKCDDMEVCRLAARRGKTEVWKNVGLEVHCRDSNMEVWRYGVAL